MIKPLVGWVKYNGIYRSEISLERLLTKTAIEIFNSLGSTFNRGDFTATNAFFWSSLNLSAFAGTDAGYTPFYLEALDGAGKKATGYLAAVGAGETLGSELVTNGDNEAAIISFTPEQVAISQSATQKYSGSFSAKFVLSGGNNLHYGNTPFTLGANKLYRIYGWYFLPSGQTVTQLRIFSGYNGVPISDVLSAIDAWTNFSVAFNLGIISAHVVAFGTLVAYNADGDFFYFDDVSIKQITDPPATAVHIVSALNGTTRNWASIESGFDPNTIASWKIYG